MSALAFYGVYPERAHCLTSDLLLLVYNNTMILMLIALDFIITGTSLFMMSRASMRIDRYIW